MSDDVGITSFGLDYPTIPEDYIMQQAERAYMRWMRGGPRGQAIMPQDSLMYWVLRYAFHEGYNKGRE